MDLFSDKIRQTVNVYEEFLNEHDRQIAWKKRYQELGNQDYSEAKETFSYQYEVWQNQISTFKTIMTKNVETLDRLLPNVSFYIKDYDILSYNQYLDILEDRKVSNTWYFVLSVNNHENDKSMGFVFYFERFRPTGKADIAQGKMKKRPHIKLFVTARREQESVWLDRKVDLVNIGTHRDQLSFGVHNRNWDPKLKGENNRASIITVKDNPNKIVRTFLDQILFTYFDVGKKRPTTIKLSINGSACAYFD